MGHPVGCPTPSIVCSDALLHRQAARVGDGRGPVVLLLTFAVFYLMPAGDPALRSRKVADTRSHLALIRDRLGLDEPWYEQFGLFVKNFATGDEYGWPGLGYSYYGNVPVLDQVRERAPERCS